MTAPSTSVSSATPRTRLLIINSPANPTGGVVPRSELDRLVAGLERHPHVAVMSDEIYGEILYDGAEHVSLLRYPPDPPPDHQQPGQSDRRRRAAVRARPPRCGTGAPPARRGDERRNLRRNPL